LGGVFVLDTAEMAKVSARGGFSLFWGLVASTVISAVGVIVIARLLSPASVTHLILTQLPLPSWTELALGAIAFLTIYIISASLIGAVKRSDIENIKEMMEELGPISKLLNPPLNIIEKLIQKIHRT
jgi:predicted phosphoribosyltransferase